MTELDHKAVDQEWIRQYTEKWIEAARKLESGPLHDACLRRAEHAMDLLEAWQKRKDHPV